MSDSSSCTRIDTLRHAIKQSGAARKELLFTFSMASTDYPATRAAVWRLYPPKRSAKKAK